MPEPRLPRPTIPTRTTSRGSNGTPIIDPFGGRIPAGTRAVSAAACAVKPPNPETPRAAPEAAPPFNNARRDREKSCAMCHLLGGGRPAARHRAEACGLALLGDHF